MRVNALVMYPFRGPSLWRSSLYPLACEYPPPVPWPVSVPPVMVMAHAQAALRLMTPSTVDKLRPSYEVDSGLFLSMQPPEDQTPMPASSRRAWASAWDSFTGSWDWGAAEATVARAAMPAMNCTLLLF